jgi:tetratricopeptide (TPR) repeat protein
MKSSQGLAAPRNWTALVCALILNVHAPSSAAQKAEAGLRYLFPDRSDSLLEEDLPAASDLLLAHADDLKAEALAEYSKGVLAEENGDTDEALQAYQRVLAIDPSVSGLAIKVGLELARRNQAPEGISILKDAIKAAPKNATLRVCLSQIYTKFLKKQDLAYRYAEEAVRVEPKNFAGYAALFDLHAADDHEKRAAEVLQRAARVEKAGPVFRLQLAQILLRLAMADENSIDEQWRGELNTTIEKAVAEGPDDPETLTKAADFYVLSRQAEKAVPLYRRAVETGRDEKEADTHDKLARALRAQGQKKEAAAELAKLLEKNPGRAETRELLGELYEEQGDLDKALDCYEATLQSDPNQPVNYLRVADLCLKTKHPERAVQVLTTAHDKFIDVPQVTYSLAVALAQAGDYAKSLAMFDAARKEALEAGQEMLNAAFYFAYGSTAERADQTDLAVEMLKKSIELDPQNAAEACNYLGYMWTDRGANLDEAGKYIRRALEAEPDNPAFIDSLGWWHFHRGEYQKALELLQRAAGHIEPPDAEVFKHLGFTFEKIGDMKQALEFWRKGAALDPADKKLAEKIKSVSPSAK